MVRKNKNNEIKISGDLIKKIIICYGTRPEVIKLSPIIKELQKRGIFF